MRNRSFMKPLFTAAAINATIFSVAIAQQPSQQPQSSQDCTVPPGQSAKPGNQSGTAAQPDLSKCKGVLQAPGVGDGEMVTPAPSTGNMPVIKPGQLPPVHNGANSSGG